MTRCKRIRDLSDAERSEMRGELASAFNVVEEIIRDVKARGDAALIEYTERFDGVHIDGIEVSEDEIRAAEHETDDALKASIALAADAIRSFHTRQKSRSWFEDFSSGGHIFLGDIFVPLERVGIYVPASYFSTALMCIIPADVAGVSEKIVCTPPSRDHSKYAATIFAAHLAGASRIFKVGGAQAIAALAFGTETIPRVQKIVGPGNIYVTAAKMLIRQHAEIDFPAGPSEIMIIADDSAPHRFIAADMLAQIEHGPHSRSILLTDSHKLASAVERELGETSEIDEADEAEDEQLWILTGSMDECIRFANEYAPEHLELIVRSPLDVLKEVRNAGSVFIGPFSPVAAGDYATGANHVLPTAGYASVFSGLDVSHFMRRMTVQMIDEQGLRRLRDAIVRLARAEGMEMHARSVEVRFEPSEERES